MKIIKAFYWLELFLEVARAKAGSSNSARYPKGHQEKSTKGRNLQNSVVTTCSSPCSLGSCRQEHFYPWDYPANYAQFEHFQFFHFTLAEDTTYTISVLRDPSQCSMALYNGGLVGPDVFNDGTNPGPILYGFSTEVLTDDCPDDDIFSAGWTTTYTIPTGGSGVYELRINSEAVWVPPRPECPREGFKYSVEISPPPIGIVAADPTCDEPPKSVYLFETGTYNSPPGAFRIDLTLSGIVEYNIVPVDHIGYSQDFPEGDFGIYFIDEAINLSFRSYPPNGSMDTFKWLFINDEEGCTRFQGFGQMHYNGGPPEPVLFDAILHDNPDKDAKDTLAINIYEYRDIFHGELIYFLSPTEVSDNFSFEIGLSDTRSNDNLPDIYPLGECHSDCDKDKDCRGNLVCFTRDIINDDYLIPGCNGTPKDDYDYCVKCSSDSYLQIPKLGICQGDCGEQGNISNQG